MLEVILPAQAESWGRFYQFQESPRFLFPPVYAHVLRWWHEWTGYLPTATLEIRLEGTFRRVWIFWMTVLWFMHCFGMCKLGWLIFKWELNWIAPWSLLAEQYRAGRCLSRLPRFFPICLDFGEGFCRKASLTKVTYEVIPLEPGDNAALLMAYVFKHLSKVSSQSATTPSFPPVTKPCTKVNIITITIIQFFYLYHALPTQRRLAPVKLQ